MRTPMSKQSNRDLRLEHPFKFDTRNEGKAEKAEADCFVFCSHNKHPINSSHKAQFLHSRFVNTPPQITIGNSHGTQYDDER